MIIRKLKLNPFAGTGNREFVFSDSLNVVLGPNESGKSTFVNALLSALFVPTDQSDARLKKFYSSYLPKTGGDTVNVELGFFFDNTEFMLSKSWGATKSSKLTAGNTSVYTSPEEISGRMQNILSFNQGTYENVLVIRQSFLADTINSIQSEAGASESIQKILRNSRFNLDGISVSRLKKLTDESVLKYFEHWDTDTEKPEGGRDIDREWKRGVGFILSAYYDYRRAEEKYNFAVKYETDLDELIKKIERLTGEIACLEEYIKKYRQPYEDLSGRRILELKQDKLEREIADLIDIQKRWPKLETEIDFLTREIAANSERLDILSKEKKNAEQYEAQRSLRKTYEKARPVYDQFLEEKEKLAGLPKVTSADIQTMNQAVRKLNESRIRFEAQKLRIKIQARQNFSAQLKEYLSES
ncbi:MAG: AAA family ATPase, partial [Syntrophothermus sp.]